MKANGLPLIALASLVLIMNARLSHGYTNPIEDQTTEIIYNDSWILSPSNALYVGDNTWGNSMMITNAGYVEDGGGYIGMRTDAYSNSVVVNGNGSIWNNGIDHLLIGSDGGSYNTLQILDGGTVYNHVAAIGAQTGSGNNSSSNNSVLVSGPGSTWNSSHNLYVGLFGSENTLEVSDGGHVYSLAGNLGLKTNANNNSVQVSGNPTFFLLKSDGQTKLGQLKADRDKTAESFIDEVKALLNTEEE